jgi:hypothetical protein
MTTVKTLRKWLKNYDDDVEVDVVVVKSNDGEVEITFEPISLSLESGNIHLGLDGKTKYMRLGAVYQEKVKPELVVPKKKNIILN